MVWINTWVDPPKEREAAQALADLGADVIARESDSTEPDKLAQELGLYSIGYNAYVLDAAPTLSSPHLSGTGASSTRRRWRTL
jgi:basic membrane protein A